MRRGRGSFIFEGAASQAGLDLLPVVKWAPVCEGQLAWQSRRGKASGYFGSVPGKQKESTPLAGDFLAPLAPLS